MRKTEKTKSGQVALVLVFLLTGLVLLFTLNVELFVSTRKKLRLQNIGDASSVVVARWQGMTLNLIGDLNFAHIKALSDKPADESTTNFIAGITALQRHLKSIGPLIGFDLANKLAERNGAQASCGMKEATEIIADSTDNVYTGLVKKITSGGVFAGIDNTRSPTEILTKPSFYKAVQAENFQALCAMGGYCHTLPSVGIIVPSAEDMFNRGCIGSVGVQEYSFTDKYSMIDSMIDSFVDMSNMCGYRNANINPDNLRTNKAIILSAEHALMWNTFDPEEWRTLPSALQKERFPWIDNFDVNPTYAVMGGSCTIRIEDAYITTNTLVKETEKFDFDIYSGEKITPVARFGDNISYIVTTNIIVAQSAAKVIGTFNGGVVTKQTISPPLVLPVFSAVRCVPFTFGANGCESMADIDHVRSFPRCSGDSSMYQAILDKYHSVEFGNRASKWFANNDCDKVCRPPGSGRGQGGGTERVP